jgi:ATP-binding cassette subfamily B protein
MKIDKAQYKLFLKFLRYLWPYRRKQISILFLSVLTVLLGLVIPYLSKLVVDKGIINKEMRSFIVLGVIGAGVFIINGLIKAISGLLKRSMRLKVNFDLNKKVFSHLQELPIGFFQNRSTGEHMFRIDYDIERVVDLVVSIPQESIKIFPRLLFILIIIFYLDWQMAIFSVVLAPIMYLPICYFTHRMRRVLEELLANSQNIFKRMEEVFSHIHLVKALGKEKREIRSYLRALIGKIRIRLKNTRLEIISDLAGGSFERVIIGLITLFGGYQVIKGRMTAGTLTAIMIYLTQLIALQSDIAFFFQRTALGIVSCKRLDEILQEKPELVEAPGRKKRIVFNHPRIEFKKVSFGYRQGENVLRNLEFNVEKGTIALVGPSGCGKSTILNLILGLYEPWQGEILIDRHNIKDLETGALREQIGVALEEPFLWNDSIENNIRYTREVATTEEVIEAAQLAGVDEFVKELPQGYRTVIGENACKLSEGQKQKISIARALIKNPKILILDEAMSSMDSVSEEGILSNIKQSRNGSILIVVSHRLSTVMSADSVYFFSRPDNIEIDSVQHLLENNKDFCNLFTGQVRIRE